MAIFKHVNVNDVLDDNEKKAVNLTVYSWIIVIGHQLDLLNGSTQSRALHGLYKRVLHKLFVHDGIRTK